jgi:hypothetical protein
MNSSKNTIDSPLAEVITTAKKENPEAQLLNNALNEIQHAGNLPNTICLQKSWEGFQLQSMLNKRIQKLIQSPKTLPEIKKNLLNITIESHSLMSEEKYKTIQKIQPLINKKVKLILGFAIPVISLGLLTPIPYFTEVLSWQEAMNHNSFLPSLILFPIIYSLFLSSGFVDMKNIKTEMWKNIATKKLKLPKNYSDLLETEFKAQSSDPEVIIKFIDSVFTETINKNVVEISKEITSLQNNKTKLEQLRNNYIMNNEMEDSQKENDLPSIDDISFITSLDIGISEVVEQITALKEHREKLETFYEQVSSKAQKLKSARAVYLNRQEQIQEASKLLQNVNSQLQNTDELMLQQKIMLENMSIEFQDIFQTSIDLTSAKNELQI